ncbi:hypothetical protein Aperf_G00000038210 [Anoplocephala perfoliata]
MNEVEGNGGRQLHVGKAQKKEDHPQLIRQEKEIDRNAKSQRSSKIVAVILDKMVTEARLLEVFSKYSSLIEAIVLRDEFGRSKGVRLVAFSSHDDVVKEIKLSRTMLGSKAIQIALAENPADIFRNTQLCCNYSPFPLVSAPDAANIERRMRIAAHVNRQSCLV